MYLTYRNNLKNILKSFELNYSWETLSESNYYCINNDLIPFIGQDPYLNIYFKQNKYLLGQDILKKGTFTPFFYITYKNKKYILLGKHRLYSLLLNNSLIPIHKKFLFIEIKINKPNRLIIITKNNNKFLIDSKESLFDFLDNTGDALTPYLWENNCTPFPPFNDEKLFEEWLNSPIEELYGDIDI